jgi:UV excision repair protein RAD23
MADESAPGSNTVPSSGAESLAFLRTQPQFAQMRSLLQTNPALLAPLLQQLATSNPQLLQLINQNQSEFYNMINEPAGGDSTTGSTGNASGGSDSESGSNPASGQRQPGSSYIQVTPAERDAIDRVCFKLT